MNLELLVTKHAPNFIDLNHSNKAVRGITYCDSGYAWAADGIQLLKVKAHQPGALTEVRDLKGKKLAVDPVDFGRMIPDSPVAATLDVQETLEAVKLLRSVIVSAKAVDEVSFKTDEEGDLAIGFESEIVSGRYTLGESEPVECFVSIERFLKCISVFVGYAERVQLRVDTFRPRSVILSTPNVEVLLMVIRKN